MGITHGLDEPFYGGAQASEETPYYLPVSIANRNYLMDLRKYQRQTIPPIRPPQDNSNEPGEQSLNQEGLWRRSQSSWHFGAGQEYFDAEDSIRQRFYTSKGVNPWTKRRLSLLNDTSQARASVNTNLKVLQVGTRLYIADGTGLHYVTDPTAAWSGGNIVAVAPAGAESNTTVQSIATDGATVWFVNAAGHIHSTAAGTGTSTHISDGPVSVVGYANGRLIGLYGNDAYEISRAGVLTELWTGGHPNPDIIFNVVAAAPNAIYFAGTCVDRTDIYAVSALDDTGGLGAPVLAMSLPDGETLNAMLFYGGAMLLGTSRGLRLAVIGSGNTLSFGPVIEITNGATAFEGQGEFVWFGWSNFDAVSTGLGRANLAQFTSEFVPAYASDLMATGQGTVTSTATIGSRRYFAVSGLGFYAETAAEVESGFVNAGKITYGTTEKKIATALDLRHEPLPADASIQAVMQTEEGTDVAIGASLLEGLLSPPTPINITVTQTEVMGLELTLNKGDTGPVLKRWTLYSRVTPVLSDEIIAPLIIHDRVLSDLGEGQSIWYDPLEEYRYLRGLAENKTIQIYQEGKAAYAIYVTGVQVQPEDWNADRSFFDGILYVRMVTVETN